MLVTEFGMIVLWHPTTSVLVAVSIMALQLLRLSYARLLESTAMDVRPLQPKKAWSPMLVTELGMVTEVRPLQQVKAKLPMLVTELGIVTEVRYPQPEKASLPMLVTELGMVTEVRPMQPWKAWLPMLVTL